MNDSIIIDSNVEIYGNAYYTESCITHTKTTVGLSFKWLLLQDQIEVSDKVLLMLGGRMDTFDITVDDLKAGSSQSREDEEFSPRAGLVFKPRDEVSIYYSMSQSFLPRSGEQYKKLTASAAALDPDVFENNEFGIEELISENGEKLKISKRIITKTTSIEK